MQRLSGMDASFLYSETPTGHMHVTGVIIADASTMPEAYDFDAGQGDDPGPAAPDADLPAPHRRGPLQRRPSAVDRGPRLRSRPPRAPRPAGRPRGPSRTDRPGRRPGQPTARPQPAAVGDVGGRGGRRRDDRPDHQDAPRRHRRRDRRRPHEPALRLHPRLPRPRARDRAVGARQRAERHEAVHRLGGVVAVGPVPGRAGRGPHGLVGRVGGTGRHRRRWRRPQRGVAVHRPPHDVHPLVDRRTARWPSGRPTSTTSRR